MRSAAQGEQAGCGLAKEEAAKGLFFWVDHALPIAIVVTMDNHGSAFAVNRRCVPPTVAVT
jgi:hypothetical protein